MDVPAEEPRFQANLKNHQGMMVVEADIDGSMWYGRLMPKKSGASEGPVILFERPRA